MKIKITYQTEEKQCADEISEFIRNRYRGVKLRKSDKYPPFFHSYLSVRYSAETHEEGTGA